MGLSCCHPLLPCQALGQALIPLPSREGGFCRLNWLVVHPASHLWIADQVRNDGTGWIVCLTLWIPACAGMTVRMRE